MRHAGTCSIETQESITLGFMNHKTASALSSLSCMEQVAFEARLAEPNLQQSVGAYLNGKTGVQFSIDIMIMGSEHSFDDIGRVLSEHRLFLQKPYHVPEGTEYRNPQYLAMADSFEGDHQSIAGQAEHIDTLPLVMGHTKDGDLESELCNILDNSLRQGNVSRVDITRGLLAELMS